MSRKPIWGVTAVLAALLLAVPCFAVDWTDWRGPNRDGTSPEKNLPVSWTPGGQGMLWKAPFPGRSTPIIMGDRLYAFNKAGEGASQQERIICLNADTGALIWEYRYNVIHSDVPPWRIAWSAPVGDPATGNVYTFGGSGMLTALSRDGKLLWQRSMIEEFGTLSTHGGRTVSPVIEGDLVVVSSVSSGWGNMARGADRYWAFNKLTGECMWVSQPGGQPFDTTYSTPIALEVNGARLLIAGAGDGAVHALKAQTGEKAWSLPISKRGVNTSVVAYGNTVYVSHSEENLDHPEMGLLAAVDATKTGNLTLADTKWKIEGFLAGYSSPVVDGDQVYQIDNGSNLVAFDAASGKKLWTKKLGTIQKSSPVFADGKIYTGNENGKFFILKPTREGCEVLDEDQLGTEENPEIITASPAISNGRVFIVSEGAMYAFGAKRVTQSPAPPKPAAGEGPAAWVQVSPTELILAPGETQKFRARLYDAKGRFLRESEATWTLEGLQGNIDSSGSYQVAATQKGFAGMAKATVGSLSGVARVRVVPPLPWDENFDSLNPGPPPAQWVGATGKFQVRDVDGNKMLVKLSDNPFTERARINMSPASWHDYTLQVDFRATERRRQMGDAGVVAQGYTLALFGSHQKLDLFPWQADPAHTVSKPYAWKGDTMMRLKLRVENLSSGATRVQGKAWPAADAEPAAWTIDHVDTTPTRQGSVGLYADAPYEIFFDNFKVTPNN